MDKISIEVNIEEIKWQKELPNVEDIIRKSCVAALQGAGILNYADSVEVSVLLTNDAEIQKLNSEYRHKDKATNVLSFPQEELVAEDYAHLGDHIALGDIAFAFETIQKEAPEQHKSFESHLVHLAIHGTLHLIGYDHEHEKDAHMMESLEIKLLAELGIESPY